MPDVPPEIEKLRDDAWWSTWVDVKHVLLSSAEAAVLACEQRVRGSVRLLPDAPYDQETTELAWIDFPDVSDTGVFVNARKHEQTVDQMRERTVREIVKELREADFEHEGIARARAWFDAADLIESRFGGKEGEDDDQ